MLARLQTLVAIAESGSMAEAARRLHFSQPALSQQMAALEAEIGAPLLARHPRGVVPTPAGAALIEHARIGLRRLEFGVSEARAVIRGEAGEIRLAAFPTASAALLPPAIAALRRDLPGVQVTVEELESDEALAGLEADQFDLIVGFSYVSPPKPAGASVAELGVDPLLVCLPADHRLAAHRVIEVGQLRVEPWVGGRSTGSTAMLVRLCAEAGFAPRPGPRTANYATAQGLVAAGLGVALVPSLALDYPRSDVVARPLRTRPVRTVFAAASARSASTPGVSALGTLLHTEMRARRGRR